MTHHQNRKLKAFLATVHVRGSAFSNPTSLAQVFQAPADLFEVARESVERHTGPFKNTSIINSILQKVRRLQLNERLSQTRSTRTPRTKS